MYQITITGDAKVVKEPLGSDGMDEYEPVDDAYELELLNGTACDEDFTQYFYGEGEQIRESANLTHGFMNFVFKDGKLWTVTRYLSNRKLTAEELEVIKKRTLGQWSDGIGENFEQHPVRKERADYYISAWHPEQIVTTEQLKVNKRDATTSTLS